MGIFTSRSNRFVTKKAHKANLGKQAEGDERVLQELPKLRVMDDSKLRLEFFFYTDEPGKASGLVKDLQNLGYQAELRPSACGADILVTGWTQPIVMTVSAVSHEVNSCAPSASNRTVFSTVGGPIRRSRSAASVRYFCLLRAARSQSPDCRTMMSS